MKRYLHPVRILIFIACSTWSLNSLANNLILTAPPRESAENGEKIYQPIAAYLSKVLGTPVAYKHPGNWLQYQHDMRGDKYDIVFDGPHFTSWRAAHLNHKVLMKLPGKLKFYAVASANNAEINEMTDMKGREFCGISPPNLSSLSFINGIKNPVLQPKVKGIHGGMDKVYEAFNAGQCNVAVLRNVFYEKKLSKEQREKLKVIFTSKDMPNQAISVSTRISAEQQKKIRSLFSSQEGIRASQALITRFGEKGATGFVTANNDEYQGYNSLLEGVIFGW